MKYFVEIKLGEISFHGETKINFVKFLLRKLGAAPPLGPPLGGWIDGGENDLLFSQTIKVSYSTFYQKKSFFGWRNAC